MTVKGFNSEAPGFIRPAGQRRVERPHGTRAKYVIERCRCFPCRVANANAQTELNRARSLALTPWRIRRTGGDRWWVEHRESGERHPAVGRAESLRIRDEWNARDRDDDPIWLGPAEIRSLIGHLNKLIEAGISAKQVARVSGVSLTRVTEILDPRRREQRGRNARDAKGRYVRRIRRATGDKLWGVGFDAAAGGARIDATATRQLIGCMRGYGVSGAAIASVLAGRRMPALQMRGDRVLAATARRVRDMHDGLWIVWSGFRLACCCEHTHQRPSDEMLRLVAALIVAPMTCETCGKIMASQAKHAHQRQHRRERAA